MAFKFFKISPDDTSAQEELNQFLRNENKILTKTKRRSRQKIKIANAKLRDDDWTQEEYAVHVQPILSLLERAKSKGFRGSVS
ncbi:MAG: hypothetical protein J5672_03590 [Verrucomicrobia bacterium]|nr:hypothetical protein [Verrucomicrobiota bacterium]